MKMSLRRITIFTDCLKTRGGSTLSVYRETDGKNASSYEEPKCQPQMVCSGFELTGKHGSILPCITGSGI